MSNNFLTKVEIHKHPKTNGDVKITTLVKKNKSKMSPNDIKKIADKMVEKYPNKKLMVKVLSGNGYFLLKRYDQSTDVILDEEVYLDGKENINNHKDYTSIYKASFYLI